MIAQHQDNQTRAKKALQSGFEDRTRRHASKLHDEAPIEGEPNVDSWHTVVAEDEQPIPPTHKAARTRPIRVAKTAA